MKKTVQIHIGGRHFHIDEDAYNKLSHYLDTLKVHFMASGDSGKEIIEDIEQRIAELIENRLTPGKQSVSIEDTDDIIRTLGKVEDFVYTGQSGEQRESYGYSRDDRRFYRDPDNHYVGGVASGLGEYFDIDPLWIRLAFVALFFLKGVGLLIYIVLWIVVPRARTTAEKLRMKGMPVNLSTIKESVNAEYGRVKSSLHNVSRSPAADRTRDALDGILRAIGLVFVAIFKFIIGALGVLFILMGALFLAGMVLFLLGFTSVFGHYNIWHDSTIPNLSNLFINSNHYYLVVISFILLVLIPIIVLIYGGIKILFNIRSRHRTLRAVVVTTWFIALFAFVTLVVFHMSHMAVQSSGKQMSEVQTEKHPLMYIDVRNNTENLKITVNSVLGLRFNYSDWDNSIYTEAGFSMKPSDDAQMHISIDKTVKNIILDESGRYLDRVEYTWDQHDSLLTLNQYIRTDDEDFWLLGEAHVDVLIPESQQVVLTQRACDFLADYERYKYCSGDSSIVGIPSVMTSAGLVAVQNQKRPETRNK
jgi:phage shock protein PspC (stress-responsive transcriptional regulator)